MAKRKALIRVLFASAVITLAVSGCGKNNGETEQTSETPLSTEAPTEAVTEAPKETEAPVSQDPVEFTSSDKKIKITLPDGTWTTREDTDATRTFISGTDAAISISHAEGSNVQNTTLYKTEEELVSVLNGTETANPPYEVVSFAHNLVSGVEYTRYEVKNNSQDATFTYQLNYTLVTADHSYVVVGNVMKDDKEMLKKVEDAVDSFQVLHDETLKGVTVGGTTAQTETETNANPNAESGTAEAEKASEKDYDSSITLYISDNDVNLRSEPDKDGDNVIGSFSKGDQVTVVGETTNWFKVNVQGNIGYVIKTYMTTQKVDTTAETEETDDEEENSASTDDQSAAEEANEVAYAESFGMWATGGVNIRQHPGTGSDIIGGVNTGSMVSIVGETDNWYKVSYDGVTGYVSKNYLTFNQPDSGSSGEDTTSNEDGNSGDESTSNYATIYGTVTASDNGTVTIQGDDGYSYTFNTGNATVDSPNNLAAGVYVGVTVDSSQQTGDGAMAATSVTEY